VEIDGQSDVSRCRPAGTGRFAEKAGQRPLGFRNTLRCGRLPVRMTSVAKTSSRWRVSVSGAYLRLG
jgi:hypothetical protein